MLEMAGPNQSPSKREVQMQKDLHHIIPKLSKTTIHQSVTDKLGYRKLCTSWVPTLLTDDHKRKRMGFALKCLIRYEQE